MSMFLVHCGLDLVYDKPLLEREKSFEPGETLFRRTASNPVLVFEQIGPGFLKIKHELTTVSIRTDAQNFFIPLELRSLCD